MNARTGVGWLCVIAFGVLLAVSVGAGDTVYTGNDLLKDLQVGKPGRLVKAEEMVETAQRRIIWRAIRKLCIGLRPFMLSLVSLRLSARRTSRK